MSVNMEGVLRIVFDLVPAMIWVKDRDNRILHLNRLAAATLEKEPEEVVGRSTYDLYPDEAEAYHRADLEVITSGKPKLGIVERLQTASEKRWVRTDKIPYRDARGEVQGIIVFAVDITDRVKIEQDLKESRALLESIVESLPFDFWACDESGRYVFQNSTSIRHWGDKIGKLPEETGVDVDVLALWTSNNSRAFAGEVVSGDVQYRIDGEERQFHNIVAPIRNDGRIRGIMGINIDTTERRRTEAALRASESRLEIAEAFSLVMATHVGLDGRWLKVTDSLCDLLGYTEAELMERTYWDVIFVADAVEERRQSEALALGLEKSYGSEIRFVRKDGEHVWVDVNRSMVTAEDGSPQYFLTYVRDVSRRKHLEEQLRQAHKMESIGRLAGGVAHDFNNILTAVMGFADLAIRNDDLDPMTVRYLQGIRQSSDRAAALTQQLLAFARKQIAEPKVVNINDLLIEVDGLLRRLIGEDIDLVTIPGAGLGTVRVDPWQFEQVLVNLAVNARDAMPDGGKLTLETRNVHISAADAFRHPDALPGAYIMISVTDTGHGIDDEVMKHLFEPFYTTKGPGKGTGLGLATCYGIVRQNGGHIRVESEPGHGATFKVYFPRIYDSVESWSNLEEVFGEMAREGTVLVVEDESMVRTVAVEALKMHGYAVIEASNGEEALRIARAFEGTIDLLVTDVVMPKLGGVALADCLLRERPGMRVLFVSGYTENYSIERKSSDMEFAFLQKPFTATSFARKVREVIEGRSESAPL